MCDCNDKLNLVTTAALGCLLFCSGVVTGKALELLNKLGCWLAQQTNVTLVALTGYC